MPQPSAKTAYTHDQAIKYDDQRFTGPSGRAIHQAELGCLMSMLRRVEKNARVLEVGCGTGRLLVDAHAAGYRVDGADASPDMLERLRAKLDALGYSADFQIAEAAKLPHETGSYDAVYAIRLLNQTESAGYALSIVDEMLRVARPGGYVLVEFVNAYRPRLAGAKTVRLKPRDVAARGRDAGGVVVKHLGAFFLSMHAYRAVPKALVGVVAGLDAALSAAFPRLCARSYVLFRKSPRG